MVRKMGSICFEDEELKSIHVCDLFYKIVVYTTGPLPETKSRNKYILAPSTITRNGVKRKQLLIMVLRLQPGF
jgi:hypothetical protein